MVTSLLWLKAGSIDLGASWCGCGLTEVQVCIGCGLTRNRVRMDRKMDSTVSLSALIKRSSQVKDSFKAIFTRGLVNASDC